VRKLISILVALGVVLSFSLMATPAAAVEEPVNVYLENEIACVADNYSIVFHNVGTLMEGDFIDIMFPKGTKAGTIVGNASIVKGATKSAVTSKGACVATADAVDVLATDVVSNISVRITLNGTIEKCDYVCITVENVTNPASCNYHLEVGTSTHTPVDSEEYTIYCAKIELVGDVNPATGLDNMNLISLPCYPDDEAIEVVLVDLFDEVEDTAADPEPFSFSVWYWDAAAKTWMKYVSDSSFTDLDTIEPGKAYWIKPSYDIDFYIHGDPYPPGQGPPIKWCYPRCWNMVGFASLQDDFAANYLAYTKTGPAYTNECVAAIWGWDVENQWYDPLPWDLTGGATAELEAGQGYWMAFVTEGCIIPPAQSTC